MESIVFKNIKVLEKKLSRLNNQIVLEKNKKRFKETQRKKSLGKIFIMAGASSYFDNKKVPYNFVIALGGLFYIASLQFEKLSILLGACYLEFEKLNKSKNYLSDLKSKGQIFYETYSNKKKKLDDLENLFLGLLLKVRNLIYQNKQTSKLHDIGDQLFKEYRQKKYNVNHLTATINN